MRCKHTGRRVGKHTGRRVGTLVFVLGVIGLGMASLARADDSADLAKLIADAWEFELREAPTFATQVGDHRFNDQLERQSVADQKRRLTMRREFLKRWETIHRDELENSDRINYDIFGRLLKDDIAEGEFEMYLIPITNRWGFHVEFPELPQNVPLKTASDYENYISRLKQYSRLTDEHIELLRSGDRERTGVAGGCVGRLPGFHHGSHRRRSG